MPRVTVSPTEVQDAVAYRKHPSYGQSDVKMFASNRRRFYEEKMCGSKPSDESKPHFDVGKFIEGMILQPYRYQVVPRDVLTSNGARRGKKWDAWLEALPEGVEPITEDQLAIKDRVYASIERHPRVHNMLWKTQQHLHLRVLNWPCQFTGLSRKGELDLWLPMHKIIVDIKTTVNPQPGAFDAEIWKWGYHIQAATYREMMESTDQSVDAYVIIAIRNKPPYDVEDHLITSAHMDEGDRWNDVWMHRLDAAVQADDWGPRTRSQINVVQRPRGYVAHTWDDERLMV